MLEISIPGYRDLRLGRLVLDYNGTLACDGEILPGVAEALNLLAEDLEIHVLTADTFGKAQSRLKGSPCELVVLPTDRQDVGKLIHLKNFGAADAVCIGNGRNDHLMLKEAALGIAVVQQEGAALKTLLDADVICPNVVSALQLLVNPLRLIATLRS